MFARASARAFRTAQRAYSTAPHVSHAGSDFPWVVGSGLVFVPLTYYLLSTPTSSHGHKAHGAHAEHSEPAPEAVPEPAHVPEAEAEVAPVGEAPSTSIKIEKEKAEKKEVAEAKIEHRDVEPAKVVENAEKAKTKDDDWEIVSAVEEAVSKKDD